MLLNCCSGCSKDPCGVSDVSVVRSLGHARDDDQDLAPAIVDIAHVSPTTLEVGGNIQVPTVKATLGIGHRRKITLDEPGHHGLVIDNWGDCLQLVALVEGSAAVRILSKLRAWPNSFIVSVNGLAEIPHMLEELATSKVLNIEFFCPDRLRVQIPRRRGKFGVHFAFQEHRSAAVRLEVVSDEGDLADFNRFHQTKPLDTTHILVGDFLEEVNGTKGSAKLILEALQEALAEDDVDVLDVVVLKSPHVDGRALRIS